MEKNMATVGLSDPNENAKHGKGELIGKSE
jgi:hypothetical protein